MTPQVKAILKLMASGKKVIRHSTHGKYVTIDGKTFHKADVERANRIRWEERELSRRAKKEEEEALKNDRTLIPA